MAFDPVRLEVAVGPVVLSILRPRSAEDLIDEVDYARDERLASVLGVSPAYFAEYRLWRVRALLDPGIVGFDRAMANFGRLRGGRAGVALDEGRPPRGSRYPPPVPSQSEERE